jgi:hypothetical protein
MSVVIAVEIVCDNCSEAAQQDIGTVSEARARARKEGFVRRKRNGKWVDLCANCAETKASEGGNG